MKFSMGLLPVVLVALMPLALPQPLELVPDRAPLIVADVALRESGYVKQKPDAAGRYVYIVWLAEPPLATYGGGITGLAGTSRAATGARLDINSVASRAYVGHLKNRQASVLKSIDVALGRAPQATRQFQHAFNGFALRLAPAEAASVAALPGIAAVQQDRVYFPATDAGPAFIGAGGVWDGSTTGGLGATKGEGVVIGVLDSGINSDHPSFADIGGDGYDHTNPLGAGNYIPGSHCDGTAPGFCNDKLIGAWDKVSSTSDPNSPEDSDGHGSHTASTAAGNAVAASLEAPTTSYDPDISGVAPHANLVVYDTCITTCPGAALLAAIDQVVIDSGALPDGIAAINYSISGGFEPWEDPVSQGFLNAVAADIFVTASAGNAGPGAGTVGHQEPWVLTVGASTHDRTIINTLVNLSSDGGGLADMQGAALTRGYGPAPIVHANGFPTNNGSSNDTNPAQCLDPFPAGTFSGQIVVCDRGTIGRVAKGQNVLAGGAGGFVMANLPVHAEQIFADPHALPAVHLGAANADLLRTWLATNTGTMATIAGFAPNFSAASGDSMSGFSSRGPGTAADVIKPDVTAPGARILAAVENGAQSPPEYGFLSGTSMSSPHAAGAAALLRALHPGWTPAQIKSALMSTANHQAASLDDASPFDRGAGRIDLSRAPLAELTWDETPANYSAADPDAGGDPRTLNLASLMDSACGVSCQWIRTVTNSQGGAGSWAVSSSSDTIDLDVAPASFSLNPGQSQALTITATPVVNADWQFGEVVLTETARGGGAPGQIMPVAAKIEFASNPDVFTKVVDKAEATLNDTLHYTITVGNVSTADELSVTDTLSGNASIVGGSEVQTVSNGTTTSPFSCTANGCTWTGMLDPAFTISPSPAPFGYVSLAGLGTAPHGCPSDCDDGALILSGLPPFGYNGNTYTEVVWSINGTLELGSASSSASSGQNVPLPNPASPNNLLAPLWTDLDLGAGGEWYAAVVNAGPDQYTIFEWEDVPRFGDPATTFTFQIWLRNNTDDIWFVYDTVGSTTDLTVGVEDNAGQAGLTYYHNGTGSAPTPGVDLLIQSGLAGTAMLEFDAVVDNVAIGPVENVAQLSLTTRASAFGETARAITELIADTDGDGVFDRDDNCTEVANPTQCDTNGDGFGNHCDADLDNNGIVNSFDLTLMRQAFGQSGSSDADLDCNLIVNSFDLTLLRGAFGQPPGPNAGQ